MLLSVIIPVYNVAPFIGRTLSSVLGAIDALLSIQNRGKPLVGNQDVEVICVDDGSTDGSDGVLAAFASKDHRIKVVSQKNAGVSAARNAGLDIAIGAWIAFVDGDDTWDRNLIVRMFSQIDDTVDCVVFSMLCIDLSGRMVDRKSEPKSTTMLADDLLGSERSEYGRYIWSVCDKFFKRSIIESSGLRFRVGMTHGEDSLFAQMFLAKANVVLVDSECIGYYYYMRETSAVHQVVHSLPSRPLWDFEVMFSIWKTTQRDGLRKRLSHIATGAFFLGKGGLYSKDVRKFGVEYVLGSDVFGRDVLPFVLKYGTTKARLMALACKVFPRKLIAKVLMAL